MPRYDSQLSQQRWEACKSMANEEIPAYAVVEVDVADLASELGSVTDEPLLQVGKPSTGSVSRLDDYSLLVEQYSTIGHRTRFNGPVPIPVGGFGYVTRDVPALALCHSVEASIPTVADNRLFAPVSGQWYLGEILRFSGSTDVTDWLAVWNMAFVAPVATSETDCVVGWVVRQSRTQEDLA